MQTKDFTNKLNTIIDLFVKKSEQYSDGKDILSAFRKAGLVHGDGSIQSMFDTLLIYKGKHDLALAENGLKLPDAQERLHDIIVYCVLGSLMIDEMQGKGELQNTKG
jgi:hypothetical protein